MHPLSSRQRAALNELCKIRRPELHAVHGYKQAFVIGGATARLAVGVDASCNGTPVVTDSLAGLVTSSTLTVQGSIGNALGRKAPSRCLAKELKSNVSTDTPNAYSLPVVVEESQEALVNHHCQHQ